MKELISKAMSSGLDFSQSGVLKSFLAKLDIDEDNYDKVFIAIKNHALEDEFREIPKKKRYIFLPQCLRDSGECEAELTDEGYKCKRCGSCDIDEIISTAEDLGYEHVYIVPGLSLIKKIAKKEKPQAVVGVACYGELVEGIRYTSIHDIPAQGIPLLKEGCKDTVVDVDRVEEILKR